MAVLVVVGVATLVLSVLTMEACPLVDADLRALRFLTVAPANPLSKHLNSRPRSKPAAPKQTGPQKPMDSTPADRAPNCSDEGSVTDGETGRSVEAGQKTSRRGVKNETMSERGAGSPASVEKGRRGPGALSDWHEAEGREWRGVVTQVCRAFQSGTADFWFRFPARPSAEAAQKRLHVHSGLPRLSAVRRAENTLVLHLGLGWTGQLVGKQTGVQSTLDCAWRARLPCPVVGFNMPTDRLATFNCGQGDDCRVLSHVYHRIEQRYPGVKIVIVASCLGALRVVNWLSSLNRTPRSLAALALESPLPSLGHLPAAVVTDPSLDHCLRGLMHASLPNYCPELNSSETALDTGVPVIVSLLASDSVSQLENLESMMSKFPHAHVMISQRQRIGRHPVAHGEMILLPEQQAALRTLVRDVAQNPRRRTAPGKR